jgi:ribulose-phosphate 3-epimerase
MSYLIVPTITANDEVDYKRQVDNVRNYAKALHIDLMDGKFAPSVSPPLSYTWWPHELKAYVHLMYQNPMDYVDVLIRLKPHMVVIHNEVKVHHMHFAAELHRHGIEVGLAILKETPIEWAYQIMHSFDQVLVFSGNLGYHGGEADLSLLDKVSKIKLYHPEAEIAWDGGINDLNAQTLVDAGVNILNVGGYIQDSDEPKAAYDKIESLLKNKNE